MANNNKNKIELTIEAPTVAKISNVYFYNPETQMCFEVVFPKEGDMKIVLGFVSKEVIHHPSGDLDLYRSWESA